MDEYVAVTNPLLHPVNMDGWRISDGEGELQFPPFVIEPSQTVYVARAASCFREVNGFSPDFEYEDSLIDVQDMKRRGRFALNNRGDEVMLIDGSGRLVDMVVYGDSFPEADGWDGYPVDRPAEGVVLKRKSVKPGHDTDRRYDWMPLDVDERKKKIFERRTFSFLGCVTAFVSPDCSFEVISDEIENARECIYVNVYRFESFALGKCLLDAMDRGVSVKLLLESSPVGGMGEDELEIARLIEEKGGDVRFTKNPTGMINHAKYAVFDEKAVLILSENWNEMGVPSGEKRGNRGWGVVIHNSEVARYFADVFLEDFGFGTKIQIEGTGNEANLPAGKLGTGGYFKRRKVEGFFIVDTFLAPDNVLGKEDAILEMIENADDFIYVEQFSAEMELSGGERNPYIRALIDAARRGCRVKMLLDASRYNIEGENNNDEVVEYLREMSGGSIEAKLADLKPDISKVHNKGMLADSKVLISSFNWRESSFDNREVGIIIENEEVADFYRNVFLHDWNLSEEMEAEKEIGKEEDRAVLVILTLVVAFAVFMLIRWWRYRF